MTHGSLFSGIGGFDLAATWMGWKNLFHCEINKFDRQVLNYYWPEAKSYEDIKATDFTVWRGRIGVLTGGFPCQPYSTAGKRLGKEDERHLWPEMLRAIREVQPRWVVGENVRGLTNWNGGLVFDEVQADLEIAGYEVTPFLLPACGVNAPHKRDRIWFVAKNTNGYGRGGFFGEKESQERRFGNLGSGDNERIRTNYSKIGSVTDSTSIRCERFVLEWERIQWENETCAKTRTGGHEVVTDSNIYQRCERGMYEKRPQKAARHLGPYHTWGGRSNWEDFPTESPICSLHDGLPSGLVGITVSNHRKESIKGFGNSVVPELVYQIFKTIQQYENLQS